VHEDYKAQGSLWDLGLIKVPRLYGPPDDAIDTCYGRRHASDMPSGPFVSP
jgi:hypothetical protein